MLSVSESFLGTTVEVKLPENCAGGQAAQLSHMRTTRGVLENVQPHMENSFNNNNLIVSLTRSIHLMILGQPGFEVVKMVITI